MAPGGSGTQGRRGRRGVGQYFKAEAASTRHTPAPDGYTNRAETEMQQTADEPLKSQPPLPLRTAGRGYGQADVATLVITCYSNLHTHTCTMQHCANMDALPA